MQTVVVSSINRATQHGPVEIPYERFLQCIHCGLCSSSCPTYVETGNEPDSPRGRIHLMRSIADGRVDHGDGAARQHLELCLDCRACESACPSGVQYGRLIEPFRAKLAESQLELTRPGVLQRALLFHILPYASRLKPLLGLARQAQQFQSLGVSRLLPAQLRELFLALPHRSSGRRLPRHVRAHGKRRARVALFLGCAGDAFYPETTVATARVLQHNGCDVLIPRQACCGAIHYHSGRLVPARSLAAENVRAFANEEVDAIVSNAAGCGTMLKEYCEIFGEMPGAANFSARVRDVNEFLVDLGPRRPRHRLPMIATYHDACHLCHGQGVRDQPRELLRMIEGLELVPLEEGELCCGAAGTYNFTQPEMAERLGKRKAERIERSGARAVFAGNVGCLLQLSRYLRETKPPITLAHPIDALWAAYSGDHHLFVQGRQKGGCRLGALR
jgi:glycolate oxidase iron-sulfur subunit